MGGKSSIVEQLDRLKICNDVGNCKDGSSSSCLHLEKSSDCSAWRMVIQR
jgi:hypothetical protein